MADDHLDTAPAFGESERDRAERRYIAALAALDIAAEPSATVAASSAALATDVARLNDIWNPPGTGTGPLARLFAEIGRLLPWRRRRLLGAMIAATNRNAETTRTLIDASQQFQSHLIWYAQTITTLAVARRGQIGPEDIEPLHQALNALGTDWLTRWESLAARDQRYAAHVDALMAAHRELARAVEQLGAGRTTRPQP
jgi:hypothetical protein